MAHPFLDAVKYPWHRPEAAAFHAALYNAIHNTGQITLIYETCGENLPPLNSSQPPNLIWRDALQNLSASGALQKLIDQVQLQFPKNATMQKVILDVVNAQPASTQLPAQVDHVDRRTLRAAMIQAFDREELEALCVEVEDDLHQNDIQEQVNLEIVGGSGKNAIVLNLIQYLDRRKLLPYLVKAVRSARTGLI